MKVSDIIKLIPAKVICGKEHLDKTITGAYVSDLLSDVMGKAKEGNLWITLQTHQNIVAVASLKDLAAIILVKGLLPSPDIVQVSENENIPLLSTDLSCFEITGIIYNILKDKKIV